MPEELCPFAEGDRVDHKLFGFGTVSGEPTKIVGGEVVNGHMEAVRTGWAVPVRWDAESPTAHRVTHLTLTKVSSPKSRPFAYWDRQWQPLLATWIGARRAVEEAAREFRPSPSPELIGRLVAREQAARDAMVTFEADEQAGLH